MQGKPFVGPLLGKRYDAPRPEATTAGQECLLPWKPFDPAVRFPFGRLAHEDCPVGRCKDFDVHVSTNLDVLDVWLQVLLEQEIGFYFADVRKPAGNVVRVYTFQPLGVPKGAGLYHLLLAYFRDAGGLSGEIKLEVTLDYARFPASVRVPPVIMRLPSMNEGFTIGA
jgi:hypothetical protein